MACSRCGKSRINRQVPPPTAVRPGSNAHPPVQQAPSVTPSDAVREAINNMRLDYVPR